MGKYVNDVPPGLDGVPCWDCKSWVCNCCHISIFGEVNALPLSEKNSDGDSNED